TGVEDDPPVRIFVMGGFSGRRPGRKTAGGRLDHGGRWRAEGERPLARTRPVTLYLRSDGRLTARPPGERAPTLRPSRDPPNPRPTIAANLTGFFEMVPLAEGIDETMLRYVPGRVRMRSSLHRRRCPPEGGARRPRRPAALPRARHPARRAR